jgi:hypothetical protein
MRGGSVASYDVLRDIVRNGSDLTLCSPISYEVLRELAQIAVGSGARIAVTTTLDYDVIRELSATYGRNISFIDGLDPFKKPR